MSNNGLEVGDVVRRRGAGKAMIVQGTGVGDCVKCWCWGPSGIAAPQEWIRPTDLVLIYRQAPVTLESDLDEIPLKQGDTCYLKTDKERACALTAVYVHNREGDIDVTAQCCWIGASGPERDVFPMAGLVRE